MMEVFSLWTFLLATWIGMTISDLTIRLTSSGLRSTNMRWLLTYAFSGTVVWSKGIQATLSWTRAKQKEGKFGMTLRRVRTFMLNGVLSLEGSIRLRIMSLRIATRLRMKMTIYQALKSTTY
jgi:hypothetical protein